MRIGNGANSRAIGSEKFRGGFGKDRFDVGIGSTSLLAGFSEASPWADDVPLA